MRHHPRTHSMHRLIVVSADDSVNKPVEASTLPVSDKPVTLSFKGGLGTKAAISAPIVSGPVKVVPPKTLGFSMADEEGEEQDGRDDLLPSDAKGLSHTLEYARMRFWMCASTSRTMQYSPQRRLRLWWPARRCGAFRALLLLSDILKGLFL